MIDQPWSNATLLHGTSYLTIYRENLQPPEPTDLPLSCISWNYSLNIPEKSTEENLPQPRLQRHNDPRNMKLPSQSSATASQLQTFIETDPSLSSGPSRRVSLGDWSTTDLQVVLTYCFSDKKPLRDESNAGKKVSPPLICRDQRTTMPRRELQSVAPVRFHSSTPRNSDIFKRPNCFH